MLSVPEGRAANQPLSVTTLSPPMAAPLPGAWVSTCRIGSPATPDQKARLSKLTTAQVTGTELAGDPIRQVLTHAPGNGAAIGGLKVVTDKGWFAARPSGTESIYKIYVESFEGEAHLRRIASEAQTLVDRALA
ncbi:MAG: hypothetical protein EOO24_05370 [Comamonadaceae bacterium]|nr:MAG: hypothetical protein EOO24_05370 [Comamonadaceae bacterium]